MALVSWIAQESVCAKQETKASVWEQKEYKRKWKGRKFTDL